jgi:hypothetical protein
MTYDQSLLSGLTEEDRLYAHGSLLVFGKTLLNLSRSVVALALIRPQNGWRTGNLASILFGDLEAR